LFISFGLAIALRAARLFLLMMGDGWICGAWKCAVQVHDKSVPIPEISLFRYAIQVVVSSSSSSSSLHHSFRVTCSFFGCQSANFSLAVSYRSYYYYLPAPLQNVVAIRSSLLTARLAPAGSGRSWNTKDIVKPRSNTSPHLTSFNIPGDCR
jgi:hypothetical protein